MADFGGNSEFQRDSSDADGKEPRTVDGNSTSNAASLAAPSSSSVEDFVRMGFERRMVLQAMEENEAGDADSLVDLLLNYKEMGNELQYECSTSACPPPVASNEDFDDNDDSIADEGRAKLYSLVEMGFSEDQARMTIIKFGSNVEVGVLIDALIQASQAAGQYHGVNSSNHEDNSNEGRKKRKLMEGCKKEAVGFTLPVEPIGLGERSPLPTLATGPPYFYYENIKHAPKGVWETMSRFLYDIKPEFVDSQFISAAMRKRGYIHNLPVQNRSAVDPLPPMTIFEAFPQYKKWWPSWDSREKLNCIRTFLASSKTVKKICSTLEENTNPPPPAIQKYVIEECKKGNLVWTGKNKVAPLEPREMEVLLGFPKGHTRSMGFRERHRALGNSFQVDTVVYHLSVLKDIFPNGMNVLSLFSGIRGAEVALHRLGIHLKNVVIVEKCKTSRDVVKDWWEGNKITGDLIEIEDVKELTTDKIEEFIMRFHGFDLVIGGSPCNNLAGSNRYSRIGLEGMHSSLFYDYVRILDDVRSAMWRISQG